AGQRHHVDRAGGRARAALGRRGDQVLAAGDRPLLVDRARLVLEERAGDAEREVLEPERVQVAVRVALRVLDLLEQAGLGQPLALRPSSIDPYGRLPTDPDGE